MFHKGPIRNRYGYRWKMNWKHHIAARCAEVDIKAEKDRIVEQRITQQVLKYIKLLTKKQRNEKTKVILNRIFTAHGV